MSKRTREKRPIVVTSSSKYGAPEQDPFERQRLRGRLSGDLPARHPSRWKHLEGLEVQNRPKKGIARTGTRRPVKLDSIDHTLLDMVQPLRSPTSLNFLKATSTDRFSQHAEVASPSSLPKTVTFIEESKLLAETHTKSATTISLNSHQTAEPKDVVKEFLGEHVEHRKQVLQLKKDLALLRGAFSNTIMESKTEKLFDEVVLRSRYLDLVWAAHFEKMESFCSFILHDMEREKKQVKAQCAEQLRRLQHEHEMEVTRLQRELEKRSKANRNLMLEMLLDETQKRKSVTEQSSKETSEINLDGEMNNENQKEAMEEEEEEEKSADVRDAKEDATEGDENDDENGVGEGEGEESDDDSDDDAPLPLEGLSKKRRRQTLAVFSMFELAQRLNHLSKDDIYFLTSNLSDSAICDLLESLFHACRGEIRAQLLQQLMQGGNLLEAMLDDSSGVQSLLGDMSIADRQKLLAHLLKYMGVLGLSSNGLKKDFEDTLTILAGEHVSQVLSEEGVQEETREQPQRSLFHGVSIDFADDGLVVRARRRCVNTATCTTVDSATEGEQEDQESFLRRLGAWLSAGKPDGTYQGGTVKNFGVYTKGPFTVRLEFKKGKTSENETTESLFEVKAHPWETFLSSPKKKVREVSLESLSNCIIGEIYAKKILLDRDHRKTGERKPLCNMVMDYFTQKYGLKKISKEYIYGMVKKLRESWHASKRVEVFALACGILRPQFYSPLLGDLTTEFLTRLYTSSDQVAAAMYKPKTFVTVTSALHAACSIFRVDDLEEQHAASEDGEGVSANNGRFSTRKPGAKSQKQLDISKKAIKRSWTMPASLRQLLVERLESIAQPACDVEFIKEDGNVLYADLDLVLESVVLLFVEKLLVDQKMLMLLFGRFDDDGNGVLSLEEFQQLIRACQPAQKLTDASVIELWNMVNDAEEDDDGDTITKEGFAAVCIRHGLQLNYWKLTDVKEQLEAILCQVSFFDLHCKSLQQNPTS